MIASFIIICEKLENAQMPNSLTLGFFATLGYQINHISVLNRDFLEQDLVQILTDKNIIITPFDAEDCLQKIKLAVQNTLDLNSYQKRDFGYIAEDEGKVCFVINRGLGEDIYPALSCEALNGRIAVNNGKNYKLFGFDLAEIIEKAKGIANVFGANFSYNYDCGDILLHYDSATSENLEQVEQVLYQTFANRIYVEENLTLLNTLRELLSVQRRRLLILDYADCDFLKSGLCDCIKNGQIEFLERKEFKNLDKARKYLTDKNFDVLLIISKNANGLDLAFINENESQNLQIPFKNLQKYGTKGLFYHILYKILEKFKKNTWNF